MASLTPPPRWLLACALIAAAWATAPTLAQPRPPATAASTVPRADPMDAQAEVPTLVHESAFLRYRRLGADRPLGWREANDTVGRIGGWRTYAREAQAPTGAGSAPPATPGPRP